VARLSVVANDHDGLPDSETLKAVDGCNLLRTDLHRWINLNTDGENKYLEVEEW
jgi:hypothetical protein